MDYKELIEKLKNLEAVAYGYNINGEVFGMDCSDFEQIMVDATDAITELVSKTEELERQLGEAELNRPIELSGQGAENFALAAQLSETQQKLKEVTAERDAAVADVCAIIWDVEEIRRGYGVDNADADEAFAGLCGSYCAHNGHRCYKEGSNGYYCTNFKWRGPQKEE